MKAVNIATAAALAALLAAVPATGEKYVAVVETEIDAESGAAAELTKADVRQVTAELRREAVKNLPQGKYNIMTSETVIAQGSAVLEKCFDENCVIALGTTIGADYIVRGIISKLGARLTLAVEVYETEDGNLVASSEAVRSENIEDLVEKAAVACAEMYRSFVNPQGGANGGKVKGAASGRRSKNGFALGYQYYDAVDVFQVGYAKEWPITENTVSLVLEGNYWYGWGKDDNYSFGGLDVPILCQFDIGVFFIETGAQLDMLLPTKILTGLKGVKLNAGLVAGGGFSFNNGRAGRYFYRFSYGTAYYSGMFGLRFLF
jgi:hypothetical protein